MKLSFELSRSCMHYQLKPLRREDFDSNVREHGVDNKVVAQKTCRFCNDEKDVRLVSHKMWQNSSKAKEVLSAALSKNQNVFEFEKALTS